MAFSDVHYSTLLPLSSGIAALKNGTKTQQKKPYAKSKNEKRLLEGDASNPRPSTPSLMHIIHFCYQVQQRQRDINMIKPDLSTLT